MGELTSHFKLQVTEQRRTTGALLYSVQYTRPMSVWVSVNEGEIIAVH